VRVRIQHRTVYRYPEPAAFGPHIVRLRPAPHTRARLLSYNLAVEPEAEFRWQRDPSNNHIARLTFPAGTKARELSFTVDAALDVSPVNPFDFFIDDRCKVLPFDYPDGSALELAPYRQQGSIAAHLSPVLQAVKVEGYPTDFLVRLNQEVSSRVRYIIRNEPGIQTSRETLTLGSGSCRDSALLLVELLRAAGLAARFVSGYLIQLADEGDIPDLAKGIDRDVLDLHAWAEAFIPGAGWVGLDGTSGLLTGEGHIPLAATSDPELAAPISGTSDHGSDGFDFEMSVVRLGRELHPRHPYSEDDWKALVSAGGQVDEALAARGILLTIGGEPTWTSREYPDLPEWNTEALGPTKWQQGQRLARELRTRLGVGPVPMQRMGKLYPGESLPRWALDLLWRKDGIPIIRNSACLDLRSPGEMNHPRALERLDECQNLAQVLAKRLGVNHNWMPGYEDPWLFFMDEENLPADVDPLGFDLEDPEVRRRLTEVLTWGLNTPRGLALPLTRFANGWGSCNWNFRRKHLFLIPGDSPMGLRLPLDRIGGVPPDWVKDVTLPQPDFEFDPRQVRRERAKGTGTGRWVEQGDALGRVPNPGWLRTALCLEPRGDILHVFLPPLSRAEDFLELVATVEDSAHETGLTVAFEGYAPPTDPRLRSCLITPDPGVIEVNLPVTESFPEYIELITTLGDAANHAGLTPQKYQVDGREVGSGGGNHITMGGVFTAESPFLRRPDLLASLLRFFQNHPSLSYLFTGLFVGPTSQAPRLDEARHEGLYELGLALDRIPPPSEPPLFPWFLDRLLRNLLVDVAGNAHRAEFCIDKLYNPSSLSGRLGIVELRPFEMPPHEQMMAAQMYLVRALVTSFVNKPYVQDFVHWGTELHDRFLLPHYLWADFTDVLSHIEASGLRANPAWYRPFLDYRFPVAGTLEAANLSLEVRTALEPWSVLGEEPTGATVSRFVDSSLERVQVRVDGYTPGRHVVAVNGYELPLRPTGKVGEGVAGVRFRAWQPAHCFQPHIGIHHPLHFDLIDSWAHRSLGSCTYHVWHPEGRAYEAAPLTRFEAAARRHQRFTTDGHMPYPARVRSVVPDPAHPFSLDLRRFALDRPMPLPEE
jgi:uncharacterized protein (DUF2126 family)